MPLIQQQYYRNGKFFASLTNEESNDILILAQRERICINDYYGSVEKLYGCYLKEYSIHSILSGIHISDDVKDALLRPVIEYGPEHYELSWEVQESYYYITGGVTLGRLL